MRIVMGCLALFAGTAAADVIPVIGAQDGVSLPLPGGAGAGGTLLLELDGYDIAAIARVTGDRVEIPLSSLSLEPGEHYLLIQVARENGDIDTLAEHTLDVYAREGVRAASRQWNLLLGSHYRVAQHPDESFAGSSRAQQTATMQWAGEVDHSTWTAAGAVDLAFDSDRTSSFDGKRWQLPGIQLRAGRRFAHGDIALAFGDGEPADSDLLFSGFNRRGLRVEVGALEGRFAAQAFTLHAEPVTAFDADVPPFDDQSSVVGSHAVFSPLAAHPDALRLSAGWLDGDSTLGGAGVFVADAEDAVPLAVGGDAWNLALDSLPFAGALWLRGEYARSRFDADGLAFGAPARSDDARRFVAQISSAGTWHLPVLEQWLLSFERQRVGAHFHSLGNLLLPNDLDYSQLNASAAWRGLSFTGRWLDQNTDVEDAALTPRVDSRQRGVTLEYSPQTLDITQGPWKWLGAPTLRLGLETTDNALRDADIPIAAYDLDNRQRSATAGVDFAHERFTLGFTVDRVTRDDRSQPLVVDDFVIYEPGPDSRERLWGVNLSWIVSERLTLSPQWQRSRTHERRSATQRGSFDNDLWSLQLQAELIPDALSASLGWSENSDRQRFFELPQDAQRQSGSTGNLDLAYRMKILTFHLRGAYGRNALRTALLQQSDSQWQAQLSVQLNWEQAK